MKKLIIADDGEINRDILRAIFQEQFEILEAKDGEETINLLKEHFEDVALLLLDLVMPKKTGLDVLEFCKKYGYLDLLPVIMITGEATAESDAAAFEYGVSDVIHKPFSRRIVTRRALNIIELYEHRKQILSQLDLKDSQLRESHRKLEKTNEFMVDMLSSVVEFRSADMGPHIHRVREMTNLLLHTWATLYSDFDYTEDDIKQMVDASALHDIGKIAISDEILFKPARLTKAEYNIMKTHTIKGCEMLQTFKQEDSNFFKYCYEICRYHHERYDGSGYPDALQGEQIPVWAQIVGITDVYDALISPRVYKAPYSPQEAIRMIFAGECGAFSPRLLKCFETVKMEMMKLASK